MSRQGTALTIAAMMTAFNAVCVSGSARLGGNDVARRKLAQIIQLHVDQGERDVAVRLRATEGNSVTLSVADDGAPLPADGHRRSNGIGLALVARLADRLAGELRVEADPKRFNVVFPAFG